MSLPTTRPNLPLPTIIFTIYIQRSAGAKDVHRVLTSRDADNDIEINPDWESFVRQLADGPIAYKAADDCIWYYRADVDADARIFDVRSFVEAVCRTIHASGRLELHVEVQKKPVGILERLQAIANWRDDQALVAWMREHDPERYRRTYY